MELLELRRRIKKSKPSFVRQDHHKKSRLKNKWRRPKGLQSKLRLHIRGKGKNVSQGYRSPRKVRDLSKEGLKIVRVESAKDIASLDKEKHCIILSATVGKKKRIVILKKIQEMQLKVLNLENPAEFIKSTEEKIEKKRAEKKQEKDKKKTTKKDKKEEKALTDKITKEEEKEVQKKATDKLLAKRGR